MEVLKDVYQITIILGIPQNPTINLYYINAEMPALIDAGPGYGLSRVVERKLKKWGFDFEDLCFLINTHEHPEHIGGTVEVKRKTGAKICIHKNAKDILKNVDYSPPPEYLNFLDEKWKNIFEEYKNQFKEIAHLPFDNYLQEGDIIDLGNKRLKVIFTPGHSYSHICLYEEKEKVLFAGDMITGEGTPYIGGLSNIFLYNKEGMEELHRLCLVDYFKSLDKLQELDIKTILPAHGPVSGKERIQEIKARKKTREKRVIYLLEKYGKMNLQELTCALYEVEGLPTNFLKEPTKAYLNKLIAENKVKEYRLDGEINYTINYA